MLLISELPDQTLLGRQEFYQNETHSLSVVRSLGLYGKERGYYFYNCAERDWNSTEYTDFFEFYTEESFQNFLNQNQYTK